jgi:Fe2+ transport system protein B
MADQRVEDIHKQDFNLFLTDLTEMKRTTEQLKGENQRISEARDAAILSAEESRILAEERQVAIDLLQSNITQLKTELTASDSQIDELKKEKAVQISNASTWADTELQLQNEVANLKADTTQPQNETQTLSEETKDFLFDPISTLVPKLHHDFPIHLESLFLVARVLLGNL